MAFILKDVVQNAIISGSGSSAGVGLAVPVDVVNQVVPKLITNGKVPRPGIGIIVLDEAVAAGLAAVDVVIGRVILDTEAQRAGLEGIDYRRRTLGDVIVAVEERPVGNMDDFVRILQNFEIGQTVTLEVTRGETMREVVVTIMDIS
jgi:2-alkenal reductase